MPMWSLKPPPVHMIWKFNALMNKLHLLFSIFFISFVSSEFIKIQEEK